MRFGRLERRYDELKGMNLVSTIEQLAGAPVPDHFRAELVRGASEIDLVNSGLDDSMRNGFQRLLHESLSRDVDYRTAAYIVSVQRIARAYLDMGIY
jgi:glutamate dehydrogenase (NAD(P)+)